MYAIITSSQRSKSQIDRFFELGVPWQALAFDPGSYGFEIATAHVSFSGNRFDFANNASGQPCVCAFIVMQLSADLEPVDLVAFVPGTEEVAAWLGTEPLLGVYNLDRCQLGEPPMIHPTVLDWLMADRSGAFILDAAAAADYLRSIEPIAVQSWAFAQYLDAVLTTPAPRILIPESTS